MTCDRDAINRRYTEAATGRRPIQLRRPDENGADPAVREVELPQAVLDALADIPALMDRLDEQATAMRQAWELLGAADAEDRPVWQARAVLEPFIKTNGNGSEQ
jgi:hypothetical protein